MKGAASGALLPMIVYLVTGLTSTFAVQLLVYNGANGGLLPPFFNYFGMALVSLLPAAWIGATPAPKHEEETNEAPAASGPLAERQQRKAASMRCYRMCMSGRGGLAAADALGSAMGVPAVVAPVVMMSVMLDLLGFVAGNSGLELAGSGLYQVVHASVVVFSALFAWGFRNKVLAPMQWVGVAIVTAGLGLSAMGSGVGGGSADEEALGVETEGEEEALARRLSAGGGGGGGGGGGAPSHVLAGVGLTLLGSMLYATNYVLLEAAAAGKSRLAPWQMATNIGTIASVVLALYISTFVLPNWEAAVTAPMAAAGGTPLHVVLLYMGLTISSLVHALSYFQLLSQVGAVALGVLQSMRAVGVFLVGGLLFCSVQESQCLTSTRMVACAAVALGVVVYAQGKHAAVTQRQRSASSSTGGKAKPSRSGRAASAGTGGTASDADAVDAGAVGEGGGRNRGGAGEAPAAGQLAVSPVTSRV